MHASAVSAVSAVGNVSEPRHVVEHQGAGQPLQQRRMGLDLAGQPVQLHMPAQRGNALCQRLQHVQPHGCIVLGVQRKADTANAAVMQRLQLCVADIGVHHGNAARAGGSQRLDGL